MKKTGIVYLYLPIFLFISLTASAQPGDTTRLRGMMVKTEIDEAGLRTLASWGANHVRWQLTWDGFPYSPADKADSNAYKKWVSGALAYIDELLPVCRQLGLKVLIDVHTLPGGRMPDYQHRMFREKVWQDIFINLWKDIATRYKNEPAIWGYDLANEPMDYVGRSDAMDWQQLAEVTSREVRAIDPVKPIVIEGRGGGMEDMMKIRPINVPGLVYSFHMYTPLRFTHQNIEKDKKPIHYPGRIGWKYWDKKDLRKTMQQAKDWQNANNLQLYVGEFSAIRWAPGADVYLRDCIDLFEEFGWGWAYHAFREYHGWSVEFTNNKADESPAGGPTSRQLVFMEAFKKNGHKQL